MAANFARLRERVAPRAVYAVVKADAYGHGAAAVARRLAAAGADRFAVAQADEGVALRRAGVTGEVLVLSYAEAADLPRLRAYGLTPALYDLGQAAALADAARDGPGRLPVHLEVDTGMGRAGIRPERLGEAAALLREARGLSLVGTFANLSSADDRASGATAAQTEGLRAAAARLREAGVAPGILHLANSAGVLEHPDAWLDAVRPGLALYGVPPRSDFEGEALFPALRIETEVLATRRVPAGTALGYGGRFVTTRDTTVAVIPIGYHDGFRRSLSGRAAVLLRGRRSPVVGAVSMDVALVDATETGADRGDEVVILGAQGEARITAWELAEAAETIPYEILCGFGPRIGRRYVESKTE